MSLCAEFNFFTDPEAADVVLGTVQNLTLLPYELFAGVDWVYGLDNPAVTLIYRCNFKESFVATLRYHEWLFLSVLRLLCQTFTMLISNGVMSGYVRYHQRSYLNVLRPSDLCPMTPTFISAHIAFVYVRNRHESFPTKAQVGYFLRV